MEHRFIDMQEFPIIPEEDREYEVVEHFVKVEEGILVHTYKVSKRYP